MTFYLKIASLVTFFTFSTLICFAQETIFNVPSADVVEKGKIFLEHESQFSDDFGLFTHYGAYGIGKHTELDLTLFGVGTKKFRSEVLGVGFKTALPVYENTKFTFGHLIPISLRGDGVGGYSYGHLSYMFPKLNRLRITSGVLAATTTVFGRDVVSFIGGIEQPITKKFGLQLDWTSGSHVNGLLIAGGWYLFSEKTYLYFGYQIPNNRKVADDGFVIELAKFFY